VIVRPLPALLLACTAAPPAAPPTADPAPAASPSERPDRAYWVARTDGELDAALDQTCAAAVAAGRPVLLQFSASWCVDCRRMRDFSQESPLRPALAEFQTLVIDPGRFDRHPDLLRAFDVAKLATWVALAPTDCRLPATAWPRLAHGAFEPATGAPVTPDDLVAWLDAARAAR
jgi:thiol-disulfide isomerase/thioredoxin